MKAPVVAALLLIALTNASVRSMQANELAQPASDAGSLPASSSPERIADGDEPYTPPVAAGVKGEPRLSGGINAGFSVPEKDLRMTTAGFPSYFAGLYGQYFFHGHHRLQAIGEVWNFSEGLQTSANPSWVQTIDTQVSATVVGGQYLYRLGGPFGRISLGGGAYLARWSVDSVDRVTPIPGDVAEASGNSHWFRPAEGAVGAYRVSRRLSLESRWIWSTYGYEHVPVSVGLFGAGWRF